MKSDLVIPGYEVIDLLGEGAFGAVYKVQQQGQFYALKVMKPRSDSAQNVIVNLRQEAKALACLRSPHVVRIHELGEVNGKEYLVMQFVDGVPLSVKMKAGASEEEIAGWALQMAKGLNEVHRRGL